MERIHTVILVLVIATVAGACGDSANTPTGSSSSPAGAASLASLAGTYSCARGADDPTTARLKADGTMTLTFPGGETSAPSVWSVEGSKGRFGTVDEGEEFTVQDGKIVFGDGTICSKQAA